MGCLHAAFDKGHMRDEMGRAEMYLGSIYSSFKFSSEFFCRKIL